MAFNNPAAKKKICGEDVKKFCLDYIMKTEGLLYLSSIACMVIIFGLACLLMSAAAMLVIGKKNRNEVLELERYIWTVFDLSL